MYARSKIRAFNSMDPPKWQRTVIVPYLFITAQNLADKIHTTLLVCRSASLLNSLIPPLKYAINPLLTQYNLKPLRIRYYYRCVLSSGCKINQVFQLVQFQFQIRRNLYWHFFCFSFNVICLTFQAPKKGKKQEDSLYYIVDGIPGGKYCMLLSYKTVGFSFQHSAFLQ